MTILEIILVFSIPLASLKFINNLNFSSAFLILFISLLLHNMLCLIPLYYFIDILEGLLHISLVSQIPLILGGFSFIDEPNILFSLIPSSFQDGLLAASVIVYSNAETDKSKILSENKGKAGIYLWTHKESGKKYIGSAVDLSKRLKDYFSPSYLKRAKNYICNALIFHTHSAFSLSILEYINISNLSKEEALQLIIEREQFYLDLIFSEDESNTYNILKVAGSLLGFKHSEKTIAKMSGENNHMFGRTGENHHLFGKFLSSETKILISEANKGDKNPRGMLGKTHSTETLAKISAVKGTTIYVYDTQGTLVNTFSSANKAAEHFNSSHPTIAKYAKNNNLFKNYWYLSYSIRSKF